ncbi:hypothetical protein [Commensalibacter papalotli (ex Servin-Garciduenas et al. 2014)]|uniref:Uncharacterized protein n=1 Tax=Commensalibacter papalotli (ex Servin-Garciduenas et al. 2014) TaxID=1208583 RepID=W7E8I7_9PROT|nr:hypothetical protein [Commensalibacter papalotli (ex Servin-Garciduenas et al. 2014)]EUK19451.1 hypothetical protein COMX_06855 [Commensalibacter papalotli (ex Servin-Garciduenas et al. 2014)]
MIIIVFLLSTFLFFSTLATVIRIDRIKNIAIRISVFTSIILVIFLLFKLPSLYTTIFPSLDEQLSKELKEKCAWQETCKVHLHEITPFRWDKAYFFSLSSEYTRQDIKRITGINFIFHRNKNLSLFLYQGKVVKYGFSDLPDDDFVGRFSQSYYFNMLFDTAVDYYKITPQNDLLSVSFITVGKYYTGYSTHAWGKVTDSTQIRNFFLDRNKDH